MTNQIRPYDPLTSENAALVLIDHQVGLMTGVRDYSTGELKHNVVALGRSLEIDCVTSFLNSIGGSAAPPGRTGC
jgi:hypothetical protein